MKRHYLVPDMSIDPSSEMNARHKKDAEEDVDSKVVLGRDKGVSWPGILQGHANGDSRKSINTDCALHKYMSLRIKDPPTGNLGL